MGGSTRRFDGMGRETESTTNNEADSLELPGDGHLTVFDERLNFCIFHRHSQSV